MRFKTDKFRAIYSNAKVKQKKENSIKSVKKQQLAYFNQIELKLKYVPWPAMIDRIRKRIFKPSFVIC